MAIVLCNIDLSAAQKKQYALVIIYCTVLSMKRVEWVVFQSFDIFSVIVHAIEIKSIPT